MADGLAAGEVTVRARAGIWASDAGAYLFGDWTALTFTLEADASNTLPAVNSLVLLHDTGTLNSDGITSDPTVSGSITDNGRVEWKLVGFDQDGDGVPDATVRTNDQGNFIYTPLDLSDGVVTVRARAGEWDPGQADYIFGNWTELNFTLDSTANVLPSVAILALLRDTGSSSSDGVTSESALTGTVSDDGELGGLRVEFDHDGDGLKDGFTIGGADGVFTYVPTGLSPGEHTIAARAGQWNVSSAEYEYGDWMPLTFTLAFDPTDPPSVASLSLRFDTGVSDSDGITADPRLTGLVSNDGDVANLKVEFDHDGDGVAEGSVFTGTDGTFRYDPQGVESGSLTIWARVREWEPAQSAYQFGDWVSISFTLDGAANIPAVLSGLALLHDTGESSTDGTTRDPRLTGSIANDGDVLNVKIEFDHDGDGVADGSALTNVQGGFIYTPLGLADGPVTIRARAAEGAVTSDWGEFSFTLDSWQNTPPIVTSLLLGNDTGSSNTDGVTTDPRVKGQATNDGGVLHMTIEFDWNDDGTADGTTITDHEGKFSYLPQGLSPGEVTVHARAKARDFGDNDYETGDWTSLSFTLEAGGPPSPPNDPLGETVGAAFDLAVTTAVETFNSNVSGTSNGTTLQFQNARFSPQGAQTTGSSNGGVSPIEETAFTVTANPSVPINFSHSSTTQVTKSGPTSSGGSFTSTGDVTTQSSVTTSGSATSGTFSESESVCETFSHSETGLGYSMTSSGSFCFSYSVSGTYSVAADGSVSIAGGYTITVTANYSYTYNSSTTEVVNEPNLTASETVVVSDSGNGSFSYNENGSFSAGSSTVTLTATAQYSLSASSNGSLVVTGNYAGSYSMPNPSGPSASASFGGNYVLTASDNALFSSSGLAGISVSGSYILVTASNTVTSSSTSNFNLIDNGNYSGGGASSNYTMTLSDFSQSSGFASVSATITNSSASVVAAFNANGLNMAQFVYIEGGSSSGPGTSSTYTLSATADSVGISAVAARLLATQSSASMTGIFMASTSGNSTSNYKESGSYNYAGRSGSYKLSTGAKDQYSGMIAGGFAVTDTGGFVAISLSSSSSGDTYYNYADAGTATGPGVTSNYTQTINSKSNHSSGVNGSAFAGSSSIAKTSGSSGIFNSSSASQYLSTYTENGTKTGGVNSTFARTDTAQADSWSNTNGHFYSSNGSSTTIGTFVTGNLTDYQSTYSETGTVWGNNFDTGWSSVYTASATDNGSFTTTGTGSTVNGNFTQSRTSIYQSQDHQWGGSGSASSSLSNFDIQSHSNSTNTSSSNGTYTVSPGSSSSNGSYSSSQIFDSGQTNHTWGMVTVGGDTTNWDDLTASSYTSSNTDNGTFSSSGSSSSTGGTADAYTSSSSSHTRTENGTRSSGGGSSTFNMNSTQGGFQISSTTSNYSSSSGGSSSASGPYSSVTHSASSYSYNENGTTASGATFTVSKSSYSTSDYNDNGTFNQSASSWSRNGNYSNSSSSGSNTNRTENGSFTGAVTGTYSSTYTTNSSDSASDDAGYSRSAAGYSSGGNYSSGHSEGWNSTYSESGSKNSSAQNSTYSLSNNSSATGSTSDSGTFSFSAAGTTANGTVTRNGNSSHSNSYSESGNDLGCESGTFSNSNNDSGNRTDTATGTYSRSSTGYTENGSYNVSDTSTSGSSNSKSGTIACGNVTGSYSSSSSSSSFESFTDNGTYSIGATGYSGGGNYTESTTNTSNSARDRTETTTSSNGTSTHTTQSTGNTNTSYSENGTYTVASPQLVGGVPTGGGKSGSATFTHDMAWDWTFIEETTYNYTSMYGPMSGTDYEEQSESHTFNATGSFDFTDQQVTNVSSTWTQTDTWLHEQTWSTTMCNPPPGGCYTYGGSETSGGSNTSTGSGYNPFYQPQPPDDGGGAAGVGGGNAGAGAGGAGNKLSGDACRMDPECFLNSRNGTLRAGMRGNVTGTQDYDSIATEMRDALIKSAVGTLKAAADLIPCTKGAGLVSLLFCFPAGTPVETLDGPMPIEQIEVGMWVRATDPEATATAARASAEEPDTAFGFEWEHLWVASALILATCLVERRRRNTRKRQTDPLDALLASGLNALPDPEFDPDEAFDPRDPLTLELAGVRAN